MRDYFEWDWFRALFLDFLKYGYRERLHPRRDYQKRPFWFRIRSNPFRPEYH